MFVIGATSSLDYSLIGRVTVAETLAFAFIPYFWLTSHRSYINANFKKSVALLALMFLGVVVGDFINQTPFLFSARVFARPIFMLGFVLFFVPVLVRDPLSLVYMVYGRVIAGAINYYRPSEFEGLNAADAASYAGVVFRVQPMITAVALAGAVFIYPRSRILAALSFLAAGAAVVMVGGARSSILVWVVAAAFLIILKLLKSNRSRRIRITKARLLAMGSVVGVVLASTYFLYIWAAPRGYLGEVQEQKMITQQETTFGASPLGFILAGRPQVYGAILGIMDRPLLGFGSWRHDLTSIYSIEAMASVGTNPRLMDVMRQTGGNIGGAGHSVVFQAWVENGVVPAIAYFLIFSIVLKVLIFNIKYENRLAPYFIFTITSFSWSFFFSPPSISVRFSIGLLLAFYVVFLDRKRPLARIAVMR